MSINGVNSSGLARHSASMNILTSLVEVSQEVQSAKSQSISLDGDRQRQSIDNQVKDDQDALAQQEQESKKQKRRDRRHKIFGWIFHPVRSATKAIAQHHAKKTGKKPKEHPVLQHLHPLKLINTLLHPRKAISKLVKKFMKPVAAMKNMFKPREIDGELGVKLSRNLAEKSGFKNMGKKLFTSHKMDEDFVMKSAKEIAEKADVKDMGKMMHRLDRLGDYCKQAANVAQFSDVSDKFITDIQVSKIENKINELKIDEQMWQNLEKMSKHDSDHDQQQLSAMLKDDASNAKSITTMLTAVNKAKSSIVSNMASHV
jgi:hypothetical protein